MSDKHAFSPTSDMAKIIEANLRAMRERNPPCAPNEPRCKLCDDEGWEWNYDDRGVRRGRRCPCWRAALPKAAQGVPVNFQDARLVNYQETAANRHALKTARKWAADPATDVYLWGSVGSGKTRLAASMLNDVFQSRGGCYFIRVPMLLLKLQPPNAELAALFGHCCGTALLVLDDIGAERETASDFTRRTLHMLYEERGDRGLPTIWTSNKSLAELGDFMKDERLASRIAGRATVVAMSGPDWRVSQRAR